MRSVPYVTAIGSAGAGCGLNRFMRSVPYVTAIGTDDAGCEAEAIYAKRTVRYGYWQSELGICAVRLILGCGFESIYAKRTVRYGYWQSELGLWD